MSIISECLRQILSARYGRDVRQSIHDGIKEIDSVARTAQNSATANAQTASAKASEALTASQEALQKAQEAQESAERAKVYAENAEAVTGVNIATKDTAGLVKGGENHIAEDGTLELVVKTTETTMPNSHEGRVLIDEIGGVCEQVTTTGSQLFDVSTTSVGYINGHGALVTAAENRVSEYIESDGNVFVSTNAVVTGMAVSFYNSSKEFISRIAGTNTNALNSESVANCAYIRVAINVDGASLDTTRLSTYKPMVNTGTEALPWEPYTGGSPAPNPEYPQEIKKSVVSGVKTHGKNFLNIGEVNKNSSGLAISVENNVITVKGTVEKDVLIYAMGGYATEDVLFTLGIGTYSLSDGLRLTNVNGENKTHHSGTFTLTEPFKVTTLQIMNPNNGSGTFNTGNSFDFSINAMLNEGAELLEFEPYEESSITLSNPIDLYGIGDVQDVIEDGKVKRRYAKGILNGSEAWSYNSGADRQTFYFMRASTSFKNAHYDLTKATYISDKLISTSWDKIKELQDNVILFNNDSVLVRISSFNGDVNSFKAWLAENPITVIYEIAEEVTEELPIADQIALNSLATFDGITYLEFDSEIEPTFKGRYGASEVGGVASEAYCASNILKQQKATIGGEVRFSGVHIGAEGGMPYIYTENGNLNFRYQNAEGGTEYANVRNMNATIKEINSRTVLWTNPNMSAGLENGATLFSISVDECNKYAYFLITFADSTGGTTARQILMARPIGYGNGNNVRLTGVIKHGETYHYHERSVAYSYDSGSFKVGQCTYVGLDGKANLDNTKLIPYQIVGMK